MSSHFSPINYDLIHPNWKRYPAYITEGYSIEITSKDLEAFEKALPDIAPETPVSVTFLAGESLEDRLGAVKAIKAAGLEPMPHFSCRRIASHEELEHSLKAFTQQADVKRVFIIAGDLEQPAGPFSETMDLIETGLFEKYGIQAIGLAGHPDGHPNMSNEECWDILAKKCHAVTARGMAPVIVTQFGFDADSFLGWLLHLRSLGVTAPVRIGVPGPASMKALVRFAARCGVAASASVLSKYGISLSKLIGSTGPDKFVDTFAQKLGPQHGPVRLHFYPFGGLSKTLKWIFKYEG